MAREIDIEATAAARAASRAEGDRLFMAAVQAVSTGDRGAVARYQQWAISNTPTVFREVIDMDALPPARTVRRSWWSRLWSRR